VKRAGLAHDAYLCICCKQSKAAGTQLDKWF
jgi:hypothetical protein